MDFIKEHPGLAIGLLLGGAVLVLIMSRGSAAPAQVAYGGPSENYQIAALSSATARANAQSAERAAIKSAELEAGSRGLEIAAQRDMASDYYGAQVNLATINKTGDFAIAHEDTLRAISLADIGATVRNNELAVEEQIAGRSADVQIAGITSQQAIALDTGLTQRAAAENAVEIARVENETMRKSIEGQTLTSISNTSALAHANETIASLYGQTQLDLSKQETKRSFNDNLWDGIKSVAGPVLSFFAGLF